MLYLEDYLEMIEHLPSELRDRFTELREMDLSVQNRVDSLEDRQKIFFSNCKRLKTVEKEEESKQIKKEYGRLIEEASEKIQISEDCYGLVDRYLRKLDQELHKFKMELEADNRGITEILENKSLELDLPATNTLKENRHPKKARKHQAGGNQMLGGRKPPHDTFETLSLDSFSSGSETSPSLAATLQQMFPLQHMGAGGSGNAIAVAASQAIAATQQLTGRRTSSLKASFEAVSNLGFPNNDFNLSRDLASAAATAQLATSLAYQGSDSASFSGPPPSKKKKGSSARASATVTSTNPGTPLLDVDSIFNPDFVSGISPSTSDLFGMNSTDPDADQDWNFDPSEPRYCICNQVSYGEMVACDNQDCLLEWFHYPCVGITSSPKGKWYCPHCTATMTRRKGRK